MTTPPPALPPDPIVSPNQVKAAPFYWPNLIAALIAAICVAIGSIGPWIAFMGMSRNNIGSGADGTITLILGIVAALALFALLNFGRTEVKSGRMVALGTVAGIAGVLAFITGFIDAQAVSSRKAEIFGTTIGPEIGWGLWMILIAGPVLAITSAIVVKQVKNIAKANAELAAPAQNFRIDLGSRSTIDLGNQAPSVQPPAPPAPPTLPAPPPPAVKKAPVPPPPAAPKPVPQPAPPAPEPAPAPTVEIAHPVPPPPPAAPPVPPPVQTPVVAPPPPAPQAPAPAAFSNRPANEKGRSGMRRAAPWAGGALALVAALAAGVWAGPYLTGGNKGTAEPAATSTTTTTTTTRATPSSTTPSSTTAAAASASSAPATFGPFTSGDAKVLVAGQPREVRGDVSCFTYSGKLTISIGPIGNPVGATMSEADLRVNSVSLGTVNGVMLSVLDGAANSSATATKDGKSYRITGTASGIDVKNPLQPYTQPFGIDVTCP